MKFALVLLQRPSFPRNPLKKNSSNIIKSLILALVVDFNLLDRAFFVSTTEKVETSKQKCVGTRKKVMQALRRPVSRPRGPSDGRRPHQHLPQCPMF